jgi:hypothetical protein
MARLPAATRQYGSMRRATHGITSRTHTEQYGRTYAEHQPPPSATPFIMTTLYATHGPRQHCAAHSHIVGRRGSGRPAAMLAPRPVACLQCRPRAHRRQPGRRTVSLRYFYPLRLHKRHGRDGRWHASRCCHNCCDALSAAGAYLMRARPANGELPAGPVCNPARHACQPAERVTRRNMRDRAPGACQDTAHVVCACSTLVTFRLQPRVSALGATEGGVVGSSPRLARVGVGVSTCQLLTAVS